MEWLQYDKVCAYTDSFYERGAFHESCLLTENMLKENKFPINLKPLNGDIMNWDILFIYNRIVFRNEHMCMLCHHEFPWELAVLTYLSDGSCISKLYVND